MNFKRTVIIAIIALLLGAGYFIYEKKIKPQKTDQEQKKNAVFTLTEEKIRNIHIRRQEDELKFEKRGEEWWITYPIEKKADGQRVSNLLKSVLSSSRADTVDESPKDLSQFGLEQPGFIITLSDGAVKETMSLGDETIDNANFYAKSDNNPAVFTVNAGVSGNLTKEPKDYRDRAIFDMNEKDMVRMELSYQGQKTVMEKNTPGEDEKNQKEDAKKEAHKPEMKKEEATTGTWKVTEPQILRQSPQSVQNLASQIYQMKIRDFFSKTNNNMKEFQLDNTDNYIKVYFKDKNEPVVLYIGKTIDQVRMTYIYKEGADEIYSINSSDTQRLTPAKSSLMENRIFSLDFNEVNTLNIKGGDRDISLKKEKAKDPKDAPAWKLEKPSNPQAEQDYMDALYYRIADLSLYDAIPMAEKPHYYGLDSPTLVIKGLKEDGKELFELTLGKTADLKDLPEESGKDPSDTITPAQDEKLFYAIKKDENILFLIKQDDVEKISDLMDVVTGKKTSEQYEQEKKEKREKKKARQTPPETDKTNNLTPPSTNKKEAGHEQKTGRNEVRQEQKTGKEKIQPEPKSANGTPQVQKNMKKNQDKKSPGLKKLR